MTNLGARTASGAIWTGASYAAGRLLVVVGVASVARLLRPEDYGLFGMAAVGVNLLEGSYDFGLRRGLVYLAGTFGQAVLTTGFALAIGVGIVLSVLLFALTPLAANFYDEPRVTSLMRMLSVYFAIACLGVVPDALLQRRLAFNLRIVPSIASPAGRYLIAIPLAALGFGAWSLAWGQLVGVGLEVAALFAVAGWRPSLDWSRTAARALVGYSSQVSAVEWLAALALNLDYLLVGHFLGSTVLGLYTLAFKLPDTTIGAAGYVGSRVLLPSFVELRQRQQGIASGFLQSMRVLSAVLVPLSVALYVLAPQVVEVLYGDRWTEAVPVVRLLALSACVSGLLQAVGAALLAAGHPRKVMVAQAAWVSVLVPGLFVAAQTSIVAVAAVHVTGMLVFAAVKFALVPSALHVSVRAIARSIGPAFAAAAFMTLVLVPVLGAIAALPAWSILLVGLCVGAGTYAPALALLHRRGRSEAAGRLRVAMLTQSFYPRIGGAESNLEALIAPLRDTGVDVAILTRRFAGMEPCAWVAGVPVYRLAAPGGQVFASLSYMANALFLLARTRPLPDLLHAHELRSPTLAAVLAGRLLGRPVVAHVLRGGRLGDLAVLRAAPFGNARLWLFKRGVDQFVAVSCETERELLGVGVPQKRIAHIAYGVDTERFCPPTRGHRAVLRRRLGFENRKVVLVVARLVPEKGFHRLLDAWPTIKAAVPSAMLVVVGEGCERGALQRRATYLDDVRIVGPRRDPLPYLQAADCFTLPSLSEGQPISLLEAMSTGLPCVATRIGGIADTLGGVAPDGLVPPGSSAALSEALVRMLTLQDSARSEYADRARRHIIEHHSIGANAAALRDLYRSIGSRKPCSG